MMTVKGSLKVTQNFPDSFLEAALGTHCLGGACFLYTNTIIIPGSKSLVGLSQ